MNLIEIIITNVQHISKLNFSLSLNDHKIHCIVGRNGVGKTTLVRALRNLSNADTFIKTASPRIFSDQSRIEYRIDGEEYVFYYDRKIRSLTCRDLIPDEIRHAVSAELPMPFGERFNFAKSASEADSKIRLAIALQDFSRPNELINFLSEIYAAKKYERLIEVSHRGRFYYAIEQTDGTYIREDYFSSGEFFLINLYRTIKNKSRLIVIDEIDLSLDSAAQVHLLKWLRNFCVLYECSILFTTHSLAIMRTLLETELSYFDFDNGIVSITAASYSYTKARLFNFIGWDRYVLTEDKVLAGLIDRLIKKHCDPCFSEYKLIYVGGGSNVVDLLKRNRNESFLSQCENVIAVLDGDEKDKPYVRCEGVYLIPIESVEKELWKRYNDAGDYPFRSRRRNFTSEKDYFNHLKDEQRVSIDEIYDYITDENIDDFRPLIVRMKEFLGRRIS
jgi:ABC-type Mn2+/Zn2+ transport system ATPase subunit